MQVLLCLRTVIRDLEVSEMLSRLREIQDTAVVEHMVAGLRDPKLGTTAKKGLLLALGRSDDPRCVPALLAAAKDPDAGLRAAAARGLPPDPRCLDSFAALLKKSRV